MMTVCYDPHGDINMALGRMTTLNNHNLMECVGMADQSTCGHGLYALHLHLADGHLSCGTKKIYIGVSGIYSTISMFINCNFSITKSNTYIISPYDR